jgi:hypothetical protein
MEHSSSETAENEGIESPLILIFQNETFQKADFSGSQAERSGFFMGKIGK